MLREILGADELALIGPSPPPKGSDAMRAKLTDDRFSDPQWIFERKLDGIRCIAVRDGGPVRLWSRNDLVARRPLPRARRGAGGEAAPRFAVDGEVVAFERGRTSFARLTQRGERSVAVYLYVFDVLWLDGCDVRALPLLARKRILRRAFGFHGHVRLTPHRNADGEAYFAEACRRGWEGLIAKRADSTYSSRRSDDWLKFKCEHGQGSSSAATPRRAGSRTRFGALLLGVYDRDGALRYAGKVGTGFDHAALDSIGDQLEALRADRAVRSPTRRRSASATSPGSAPRSSRRSASPSGRATAACATPASRGCATTRRRATWSARADTSS